MFVDSCTFKSKSGKVYTRHLLRHGYRIGKKVFKKTLCNLSDRSESEISALKIAFEYKDNVSGLKDLISGGYETGKFVGPICLLDQVAENLGIKDALGDSKNAKLILWLIYARLIDQGSRLSATRLAGIPPPAPRAPA